MQDGEQAMLGEVPRLGSLLTSRYHPVVMSPKAAYDGKHPYNIQFF